MKHSWKCRLLYELDAFLRADGHVGHQIPCHHGHFSQFLTGSFRDHFKSRIRQSEMRLELLEDEKVAELADIGNEIFHHVGRVIPSGNDRQAEFLENRVVCGFDKGERFEKLHQGDVAFGPRQVAVGFFVKLGLHVDGKIVQKGKGRADAFRKEPGGFRLGPDAFGFESLEKIQEGIALSEGLASFEGNGNRVFLDEIGG